MTEKVLRYEQLKQKVVACDPNKRFNPVDYWQGSLDAEIILLGQELFWPVNAESGELEQYLLNANLGILIQEALGFDNPLNNRNLFLVNCLNLQKRDKVADKKFEVSLVDYICELLDLIRPRLIISLGELNLRSLEACGNFYIDGQQVRLSRYKFKELVEGGGLKLQLHSGNLQVSVCPSYNCAVRNNFNRSMEQMLTDWRKIKVIYDGLTPSRSNKNIRFRISGWGRLPKRNK